MYYYVFREAGGGTARYLTDDRSGAKLPAPPQGQKWIFDRVIKLTPGKATIVSHDEAIAAIAQNGYFKF